MKLSVRMLAVTLLASTFATAAWAQGLGHVHFPTSCTPQAQEKFDLGLARVHSFVYPESIQHSPKPLRPIRSAPSPTGASRSAIAPIR